MTMQNLPHPDDERLAAYAGGDVDVTGDASLVAHLNTCDRCRPLVVELSLLRGALAELPDLAPSRPLRLIPPVPAPAATSGGWLRRLTAPAMAAGAGLVLVGAIGIGATSGAFGQAASAMFESAGDNLDSGGGRQSEATASDNAYVPGPGVKGSPAASANETRGSVDSAGASTPPTAQYTPAAAPSGPDATEQANRASSDEQPWLTLLIAGAAIFVTATALRFTISPRAG
jgi:hypothetical protein